MRDYAKIAPTFWTGETGKALRSHGPEAVIVAMYLMSSPMSNMLGLYPQPFLYMAHDTGLGLEGTRKGLAACELTGFARYDEKSEFVWVVEMASWQIAKQLKRADHRCVGIQRDYMALPKNPFLWDFFSRYQSAFFLSEARGMQDPSKSLPSQEQEQEQEQAQEQERAIAPNGAVIGLAMTGLLGAEESTDPKAKLLLRLAVVASDAIKTFNASKLVKPQGGLLACVSESVGKHKRQQQVARCLKTARDICQAQFGSNLVTPQFWADYWTACFQDEHKSGRRGGGKDHPNWVPTFEYLTRESTVLEIYDRAQSEDVA